MLAKSSILGADWAKSGSGSGGTRQFKLQVAQCSAKLAKIWLEFAQTVAKVAKSSSSSANVRRNWPNLVRNWPTFGESGETSSNPANLSTRENAKARSISIMSGKVGRIRFRNRSLFGGRAQFWLEVGQVWAKHSGAISADAHAQAFPNQDVFPGPTASAASLKTGPAVNLPLASAAKFGLSVGRQYDDGIPRATNLGRDKGVTGKLPTSCSTQIPNNDDRRSWRASRKFKSCRRFVPKLSTSCPGRREADQLRQQLAH